MMHISKGLWEGVICATFGELPDSDNPLIQKYKKDAYGKFAAKDERWDKQQVSDALNELLTQGMSHSAAARRVAALSGWARSEVYALGLKNE